VKTVEKILVLFLLIMLVIPAIQKEKPVVTFKKLEGDFIPAEKPVLTTPSWMNGNFQIKFDKYLEENIGFRNLLVRLINQIDYNLFRTTHAEGVVVGKKDQLLEYDYIRAYTGVDFIGEETIDRKIRKLKFIQEHLKKEKNIDLILVFETGKTSYYSECIPSKYLKYAGSQTNYDSFIRQAKIYDLRYIDFNAYFKQLKEKTEYPLYPQYGIHWSTYGMSIVADSLLRYIENIRQVNLPDVYTDSLIVTTTPEKPDYDIASTLNLLFHLPKNERLAYPVYRFEENPEKYRPMVLAVADSYYWNIFNTRIPKNVFKNEAFWYFYGKAITESYGTEMWVKDLNLKEEVEKQDVIFLMVTERFLHKLGWGFIEDTYALYGPLSGYDVMHNFKCDILNYYEWLNDVIEKARVRNIPLEEMLELDAEYLFNQKSPDDLLILEGPEYFERAIRRDPNWLTSVRKQAAEKGVSLDEMIRLNAVYIFETDHKETYEKYLKLNSIKDLILNDSLHLNETKELARKYYLTFKEALQIEAEQILEGKDPW
jgi:hypothetical protein